MNYRFVIPGLRSQYSMQSSTPLRVTTMGGGSCVSYSHVLAYQPNVASTCGDTEGEGTSADIARDHERCLPESVAMSAVVLSADQAGVLFLRPILTAVRHSLLATADKMGTPTAIKKVRLPNGEPFDGSLHGLAVSNEYGVVWACGKLRPEAGDGGGALGSEPGGSYDPWYVFSFALSSVEAPANTASDEAYIDMLGAQPVEDPRLWMGHRCSLHWDATARLLWVGAYMPDDPSRATSSATEDATTQDGCARAWLQPNCGGFPSAPRRLRRILVPDPDMRALKLRRCDPQVCTRLLPGQSQICLRRPASIRNVRAAHV